MCPLANNEPVPVSVENENGSSDYFLTCDHASNRIPESLKDLGLGRADLDRHIAWDIGAANVARQLSRKLDATLILQNYSRLVIDCNRPSSSEQLIPLRSEASEIPGNQSLAAGDRRARRDKIFRPYHDEITQQLDGREKRGQPSVFVAIHSFTPVYLGAPRPWHLGILYGEHTHIAESILEMLSHEPTLCVGDNQPYRIDHNDYGIPVHGDERGIPNVLFEIRQDLIADEHGQSIWADRLAELLQRLNLT